MARPVTKTWMIDCFVKLTGFVLKSIRRFHLSVLCSQWMTCLFLSLRSHLTACPPLFHSPVFPIPSYYSYSFEYSSLSSRQSGECDCRRGCFSFQVIHQCLCRKYANMGDFFSMVSPPSILGRDFRPVEQSRMWESSKWQSDISLCETFGKGGLGRQNERSEDFCPVGYIYIYIYVDDSSHLTGCLTFLIRL